ncbi:MAG: hypothetical protein HQL87_16865 [Magnetococcales bacterium]|nr:hypothetical protein [Magnetococcales bacterium]
MDRNWKSGGMTGSVTPSTALLNQRLAISPGLRMLDASEIVLLRRSKQEMACRLQERLAQEKAALRPASAEQEASLPI